MKESFSPYLSIEPRKFVYEESGHKLELSTNFCS